MTYYIPRLLSPHLKLAVCLDTSGSISIQKGSIMLVETYGIADAFDSFEMMLILCDADIQKWDILQRGDEIPKLFIGRGGTDFRPPFKLVEDQNFNPDCLIYFTDLEGTFPEQPPTYPVIWGVVNTKQPPWGRRVEVLVE
jgi:predicted metal-dependent peptidase